MEVKQSGSGAVVPNISTSEFKKMVPEGLKNDHQYKVFKNNPSVRIIRKNLQISRVILYYHSMKTELVTTLKRQATKILAELHDSKEPVLITEHGQPSAYLVDVNDYEMMQNRMYILEGLARGEAAIRDNRVYTNSEAKEKMSKWLK